MASVAALAVSALATASWAQERPRQEPTSTLRPAANVPDALEPGRVDWRRIDFKASKFFVSATTSVAIAEVEPGVGEISLDTRVLGRRTLDASRFRLADAAAVSSRTEKQTKNPYAKLYRFADRRVIMDRREPADVDEATVGPESWSLRREESFETAAAACADILDPSVVLYLAAARRWRVGDPPFTACTFSGGKFSRMVIEAAGEEDIDVEYEVVRQDGTTSRRQERVRALLLTLDAESLDPSGGDRLEVLGLEDDVCMYVDPKTGAPLRFRGKMEKLGTVSVELQRLVLR